MTQRVQLTRHASDACWLCKRCYCYSYYYCSSQADGIESHEPGLTAGAEIKISRPVEDKNPVVIARLGRDESKRTVTFYGHYDVQPAMEREWTTDPFEMNAIDGYYYGRGTSDNKVSLSCTMHAVGGIWLVYICVQTLQGKSGSIPGV